MTAALAAAVLFLHAARAHAACTKDTDCKDELVCEAGACVTPTSASPDDANGWGLPPPADESASIAVALAVPSADGDASGSSEANTRSDSAAPPPRPLSSDANAKLVEKPMRPTSQPGRAALVPIAVRSGAGLGIRLDL